MPVNASYRGHWDGSSVGNVDTAPISVNAGDWLVVATVADSWQDLTHIVATMTWPDSRGFTTWVDNAFWANSYDGVAVQIAAYKCPTAGNPGVHVVTSGSAQGHRRPSFDVWTVSGAHPSNPIVGQDGLIGYGNPANLTFRSTPGTTGNTIAIICGGDPLSVGRQYVTGSGVASGYGYTQPSGGGEAGLNGFSTAARWTTPDTNQSLTVDPDGSTPTTLVLAVMEFQAPPVVPTVDAGADRSVERTVGIIRTAGETSDGGAGITSRQWRLMSGPAGSGAPVDLAAYGGDPKRCLLPSAVAGTHVIRYTATNSVGPGYDEATITVTPLRPTVNAGPDATQAAGLFTRTATEVANDAAITSREWKIIEGPGAGTVIGTAVTLSWTPPTLGRRVIQYTATSSAGRSDPSTFVLTVGVTGVPLRLGRTPAPRLAVAVAFGGNLADPDGSDWVFTEVTEDVRIEQGVHLRHGRSDEASASQPASCTLTLNNRHGRYSLGGLSPNWPNVRQGTPVQVSCDLGSGFQTLFTGYADGWSPLYSTVPTVTAGRGDSVVVLSASGTMRRLQQGQPADISPMRRGLTAASGVVAYWPCEDEKGARQLASVRPDWPVMTFSGRLHVGSNPNLGPADPRMGECDDFTCSHSLPLVSDSEWYGKVLDYAGTSTIETRFLCSIPAAGSNDGFVLVGIITSGDPGFWEIRYKRGNKLNLRAWRNWTSLVLDQDITYIVDGRAQQIGLRLTQNGSAVDYRLDVINQGDNYTLQYTGSIASATVGKAQRIQTCTDGGHFDVGMGHIVVRNAAFSVTECVNMLNGWAGETVGARLSRITTENGLWFTMSDGAAPVSNITDYMGPQPATTTLGLYRDCEVTDQGILWDGQGPGLSYTTKRYRESRAPALTLNAAAGEVGLPFAPVHDDAYRVNRAVVTRRNGSSATFVDATGPLGADVVGRYDDALTPGCQRDTALVQYAGWLVGQGTVEGYRYPRLALDLRAHPQFLDEWLTVIPGARVDVANLPLVHPSAPVEPIMLAVEGYEQTITMHGWSVLMNTSLFQRWAVAQVAAETAGGSGDPRAEFCARVDTDYSYLYALVPVGATQITVFVDIGPPWTTRTIDYPFYLDVGAVRVLATACTAPTAFRQTFTVEPMPVSRPAGTKIQLWQPPVYGL